MIYAHWLVRLDASTKNNFQLLLAYSQSVIPSMLYMTKCYFVLLCYSGQGEGANGCLRQGRQDTPGQATGSRPRWRQVGYCHDRHVHVQ